MNDLQPNKDTNEISEEFANIRQFTAARIGIGRSGGSLTTEQILDFDLAHARARDAVNHDFNATAFIEKFNQMIFELEQPIETIVLHSMAKDKSTYLKRPDFGRKLHADSIDNLKNQEKGLDLAIIISDGLSARAVESQVLPLLQCWLPMLRNATIRIAPILVVPGARVGISDHVGELLRPRATVILLGERPGLATPESLGAYFTFEARAGRTDADRNCISNIHADGLSSKDAAEMLQSLLIGATRLGLGGVRLSEALASTGQGLLNDPADVSG